MSDSSVVRLGRPPQPLQTRFWPKVDKSGGPKACWPWKGRRSQLGYGLIKDESQKRRLAHRVAFLLAHGRWPDPCGCHRCDNPPCCNPDHIFEGTQAQNLNDMTAKGRRSRAGAVGERNRNAKLCVDDVRRIRTLHSTGVFTNRELASAFSVSGTMIGDIVRRKNWTHVP